MLNEKNFTFFSWVYGLSFMRWEFAEYSISNASQVDLAFLHRRRHLVISQSSTSRCPQPGHLQLFPDSARQTKVKMRSTQLKFPFPFIFFLPFVLRILHNGCSVCRQDKRVGGKCWCGAETGDRWRRRNTAKNLITLRVASVVEPIEGQYSGHARELVNRFIARLVDRTLEGSRG